MDTEYSSLERLADETAKAYGAFLEWVELGTGRSMPRLLELYRYRAEQYKSDPESVQPPPTMRYATLRVWSAKYRWQDRLAAYVDEQRVRLEALDREKFLAYRDEMWQKFGKMTALIDDMAERFETLKVTRRQYVPDPRDNTRQVLMVTSRANTVDLRNLVTAWERLSRTLQGQLGFDDELVIHAKGQAANRIKIIEVPNGND